ncbi:MAG: secretin N-terminal domain-containing protein [Candidatus Omnitrophota bacterium]
MNDYLKRLWVIPILAFFLIFFLQIKTEAQEELPFYNPEVKISMDFQDASIKDILKVFSIQSGLNFIASEGVQDRTVTLFLDKVPIREAVERLFEASNLSYQIDKKSNIITVIDWGAPAVPTITRVYRLKFASVSGSLLEKDKKSSMASGEGAEGGRGGEERGGTSDTGIKAVLERLISEHGSIVEDVRTNSIIVTDMPSRFPRIEEAIAALDQSVDQILLEVEMLDVSKDATENLGFKYGARPFTLNAAGTTSRIGFPFGDWSKIFYNSEAIRGTLSFNNVTDDVDSSYTAFFEFLKSQVHAKFLARPRIVTLNNETAEIKIATQESVGVTTTTEASSGTTSAEPERVETGIVLRVTPQISPDSKEITLFIYPRVSEATQGNVITSGDKTYQFYDPEVRSSKSVVRLKDQETVIIGGLIKNKKTETITKLPFFGDIPVIGKLFFTHKELTEDSDRELLIFITPRILREGKVELAKAEKTNVPISVPVREQSPAVETIRQEAINNTLSVFDKKTR